MVLLQYYYLLLLSHFTLLHFNFAITYLISNNLDIYCLIEDLYINVRVQLNLHRCAPNFDFLVGKSSKKPIPTHMLTIIVGGLLVLVACRHR